MTAIKSPLRMVWKSLTGISVMYPDTRADSGVTSPATKASSVDSKRAAPVQRSQCAAVYQMSQAAKPRKAMRRIGKTHRRSRSWTGVAAVRGEALSVNCESAIEAPAGSSVGKARAHDYAGLAPAQAREQREREIDPGV